MVIKLPSGIKEYYGANIDYLPGILKTQEAPFSTAKFMKARIEHGEEFPDLWNIYINSSDLTIYPAKAYDHFYTLLTTDNQGRINENGRKALELIRKGNLISNNGALVKPEQLEELKGDNLIKISRKKLHVLRQFSKESILEEKIWRILSRHPDEVPTGFEEDPNLLKEYSGLVAPRTNHSKNMAFFIDDTLEYETFLKAWSIGRVNKDHRSRVGGSNCVNSPAGRVLTYKL